MPKACLNPIIVVCARCGKIDINAFPGTKEKHMKVCDPEAEARRRYELNEDYKGE